MTDYPCLTLIVSGCFNEVTNSPVHCHISLTFHEVNSLSVLCWPGVLGLRLLNGDNTDARIEDSVHVIGSAFRALQKDQQNITEAPHSCAHGPGWNSGTLLLK